jgi:hypothetical protein
LIRGELTVFFHHWSSLTRVAAAAHLGNHLKVCSPEGALGLTGSEHRSRARV